MIQRCTNPDSNSYPYYGGRGIAVCDRWKDFKAFLEDMGERPSNLTLGRIKNNLGYQPGNCRWETWKEQERNRRNNSILTVRDITDCVSALCERFNVKQTLVHWRLKHGWIVEDAFFIPKRDYTKGITHETI